MGKTMSMDISNYNLHIRYIWHQIHYWISSTSAIENKIVEHKSRIYEDLNYTRKAALDARLETENARAALSALKDQREKAENTLRSIEEKSGSLSEKLIVLEANIKNVRVIGESNCEQIQLVASGGGLTERPDISTQMEKSSSLRVNSEFSV